MIRWHRRRRRILKYLAQRIGATNSADLVDDLILFARRRGIAINRRDAEMLVREAFQLRVAQEIQKTRDDSVARDQQLNDKIDGFHPP